MIRRFDAANDIKEIESLLASRATLEDERIRTAVKDILEDVRLNGDDALFKYSHKFDGVEIDENNIRVSPKDIENAYNSLDKGLIKALECAADNIRKFHEHQLQKGYMSTQSGITLGQIVRPIEHVGVYVPGGTAAYPSSVIMNIMPAKVAGVKRIIVATPPGKEGINPGILAAAKICGVTEIYSMGGAQAIAAMAYGTKSVPKMDKITGPGNIYVAAAKREVYGVVGIDMIAGPSELLIIADNTAPAAFVAADLLSQAEHDKMSACILITDCALLAHNVEKELLRQLKLLKREEIAGEAIRNYGMIIIVQNMDEAIRLANLAAPEHLELSVKQPLELLEKVENAGAVFLGHYSPEALGDYYAGANHVLPTSATARFFSPLGVYDFVKRMNVVGYERENLKEACDHICTIACCEGLTAHLESVKIRFRKD